MGISTFRWKTKYGEPNWERISWLYMRISGLVMFIIVTFHLLYMHMVVGVDNLTFQNIVDRWNGPYGLVWKTLDAALLMFGMSHGYNGVRWSIEDYVHHKGWNLALKMLLYIIGSILVIAGTLAIFVGPGSLG